MSNRFFWHLLFSISLASISINQISLFAQEEPSLSEELAELETLIAEEPKATASDNQGFNLDAFSAPLGLDLLPSNLGSLFKNVTVKDFSFSTEEKNGFFVTTIRGIATIGTTKVTAQLRTRTADSPIKPTTKEEAKIPFIEALRLQVKKEALAAPVKGENYTTAFKIGLPARWKLSDTFKELAPYDPLTITKAWIIISDGNYQDDELPIGIKAGITIFAEINFKDLAIEQSIVNKIRQTAGKTVDSVVLYGQLDPEKTSESIFKVLIPVPEQKKISFYDLLPVETINMPAMVKDALRNTMLIKPVFELALQGNQVKKIELESGISFMQQDIAVRFLFQRLKNKQLGVSAALQLSPHWKFSDLSQDLSALDKIKIIDPTLIIANFSYDDVDRHITVENGLNFYSGVIVTDALKELEIFIQKVLSQYIVVENLAFKMHGVMATDIKQSELAIEIPAEIGVDFEKMWKDGIIKNEPYFQRITTSSLKAKVSVTANVDISAGIFVKPKSQEKPIEFRGGVRLLPNKAAAYGSVTAFDPVFGLTWLGFGPFGIEMGWDYAISSAVAAATGIPLPTDVGLRGELRIGKVPNRTVGQGAFKIEMGATDIGNFLIHIELDQTNITNLLSLLAEMVKQQAFTAKLPEIKFVNLKGYLCLQETTLAGQRYKPGLDLMGGVTIGSYHGHGEIRLSEEGKNLYIAATMDPINLPYFKLNTATFKTLKENVGAKLLIDIGVARPLKAQIIYLNGAVEIPAIGLTTKTNFDFKEGKITTDFLGIIFNKFQANSHLELPSDDLTNFVFSCGFKNDFYDYLKEQLPTALDFLHEKTTENIDEFKQNISEFRTSFHGDVDKEVERTNDYIKKTKVKIEQLKNECSQAEGTQKAVICPRNLAIAFELGTQLTALEIYKHGLLKTGRTAFETITGGAKTALSGTELIAKKTLDTINDISQGVFVVTDILSIKGASLKVTGKELKAGKLPRVQLKASVKLPNQETAIDFDFGLQFDVKNPANLFIDFGEQFMLAVAKAIQENTHYLINATPYPFEATLIGNGDKRYTIPAHTTITVDEENFLLQAISLTLKTPAKSVPAILQETLEQGSPSITYTILCEPNREQDKVKFFLHRKPQPSNAGGLVAESQLINLAVRQ